MNKRWIVALLAPSGAFLLMLVLVMVYLGTWDGNADIISRERIAQLQSGGSGTAADLDTTLTLDATRVATHFVSWAISVLATALVLTLLWNVVALRSERRVAGPGSQTRNLNLWVFLLLAYFAASVVLWFLLIVPQDLGTLINAQRQASGATPTFLAGLAIYWIGTAVGASRVMKPSVPFASVFLR